MLFKDLWARHTIAIPKLNRTFERHTRNKAGEIVRVKVEELVHVHDVYRQKIDGKVQKKLWHRGAAVGYAK